MKSDSVYEKQYYIEISDVDFTKKLKLSGLFNYFQDIASMAADSVGAGIATLEDKFGAIWMLVRIRVDIIRNPSWNEEIVIETWPQEPQTLENQRDFLVRDSNGNIIIKAVSTWVILDIKTRKLKKISSVSIKYPEIIKERAIDCKLGKLKSSGNLEIAYKRMIGYSAVDLNGHLNNSKYIDFIMDCFSIESHNKYAVKSIEVSYINEALPGETVILYKDISSINSNLVYIEGIKEENDKVVFKAQIEIENKAYTSE